MVKLERNRSFQYLILAGIVLIGTALRFYHLGEWSFWIDELFTVRDAFNHNAILIEDAYQINPSVDYGFSFVSLSVLLVRFALITFGISEWSGRLFPALIGILSLPAIFFPVRQMLGAFVALVSVFFLAISPWHIQLSQNTRYYTTLLLFSFLALYAFYLSLERNKAIYLILAMALLTLATLERILALFFVPVAAAYIILLVFLPLGRKPVGLTPKNMGLVLSLPVVLYIGYELLYSFVLKRETFLSVFLSSRFLGLLTAKPQWLVTGMLTDLGLPLAILAIFGGITLILQRNRFALLLTLGATVPVVVLMVLAPFFQTSIHYTILSLPCWFILAGAGLKELYQIANRNGGVEAVLVVITIVFAAFMRDRVVRDVAYYLDQDLLPLTLVVLFLLAGITAVFLAIRLGYWLYIDRSFLGAPAWLRGSLHKSQRWLNTLSIQGGRAVFLLGLLPILVFHPLAADWMYFQFQHGYRDNDWRSAMAVVRSEKLNSDVVISAVPPVASFYLGALTMDLRDHDVDTYLQQGRRVWVIQEYGTYLLRGEEFDQWLSSSCQENGAFDRYVRGRNWKMRVMLCTGDG